MTDNIKWHEGTITHRDRINLIGKPNKVIWFTGLSGSGKSTIARKLEEYLHAKGIPSYVLDGDNIRHGLNEDLGFTPVDRKENIRRISEVTKLFYDSGLTVIVCFISPYANDRNRIRKMIGKDFIEVFVDCPLEVCQQRDPKGLYKKAIEGQLNDFTGISSPYEPPKNPEIVINSEVDITSSVNIIYKYLNL